MSSKPSHITVARGKTLLSVQQSEPNNAAWLQTSAQYDDDALPYLEADDIVNVVISGKKSHNSIMGDDRTMSMDTPDNQCITDEKNIQGASGSLDYRLERERAERAARVHKRRHPSNPILRLCQRVIPYGGIMATAFGLASSTIGGGIIALPAAFQISGLTMSVFYLVVMSLFSIYSFVLLAIVAEHTGLRNWQQITRALLGRGADYVLAAIMWSLCFGGGVSYTVALQSLLRGFIDHSESTHEFLRTDTGMRCLTAVVWLVAILPLCLLKELNSLRVVSSAGMCFIGFFVLCIIIHSAQSLHVHGMRDDIVYFQQGNQAIQGLSIYMFVYIAQVNALEAYREMYKPSVLRMFYSATVAVMMCLTLYFLAGLFGYLDFGSTVTDSVLSMYNPMENPLIAVSYAGIVIKICVAFALHLIPARDAIYYVVGYDAQRMPWWKNCILCGFQSTCALILGLFIPKITTIFSLLGGFCGGSIEFVFPALYMMYLGNFTIKNVGWGHYLGTYLLLIVGVIGIVFGTAAAVYAQVTSG